MAILVMPLSEAILLGVPYPSAGSLGDTLALVGSLKAISPAQD